MRMNSGLINSVLRKKERAERDAYEDAPETFEERIEKAEKNQNFENVMATPGYAEAAEKVLKNYTEMGFRRAGEEEIENLCPDHDPAVIMAICKHLLKKKEQLQ